MPGGSRPARANQGVSQQARTPKVLSTLYGSRICTLKTLLLGLLSAPSGAEPRAGNSHPLNLEGQGLAARIPPTAGSNRSLYSDLLNDFRSSASLSSSSELVEHADKDHRASKALEVAGNLVREADSDDYLNLLNKSYAALRDGAQRPVYLEFDQRWTQKEVVNRVIEVQFQESQRPRDVLCAGFRKLRPGTASCTNLAAPRGLECAFPNRSLEILKSDPWTTLLSRVGDAVMLYLLSNASIFISTGGSSFLQVVGPAINTVASTSPRLSSSFGVLQGDARSPSFAPSRPSTQKNSRSVSYPKQKLRTTVASYGRSQWNTSYQEPRFDKPSQPHATGAESRDSRRRVKRKRVNTEINVAVSLEQTSGADRGPGNISSVNTESQRVLDALGHASTGRSDGHVSPGRNSPWSPVRSKRLRMTVKREAPSSDWGHGLGYVNGKKSSEAVKRCRRSAQSDDVPMVPANCRSILKSAKQGDGMKFEIAGDSCVHERESPVQKLPSTTGRRVRPPSWQRRKAHKIQQNDAAHLSRGESPQTKSLPQAAHVQVGQLLSEDLPSLGTLNTNCDNSIHKDQTWHVVTGGQRPNVSNSTCSVTLDCDTELLDEKANNSARDINAHLPYVGSFCKTVEEPTQPVKSAKEVDRCSIFYSCAFSHCAGLPAKHILNATSPNSNGALQLFGVIFRNMDSTSSLSPKPDAEKSKHSEPPNYRVIRSLLKKLLHNVRKCQYARLLNRHCALQRRHADTKRMVSSLVGEVLVTQPEEMLGTNMVGSAPGATDDVLCKPVDHRVCSRSSPEEHVTTAGAQITSESVTTTGEDTWSGETVPVTTDVKSSDTGEDEVTSGPPVSKMEELISSFSTHRQVVAFLWAVTRRIIPERFLGCKKSWRLLRSCLARFISLRRHEKFSLKQYLFGLKTHSFDWLQGATSAGNKNVLHKSRALELWSHWYFTSFVVPLIRAHFYVTESQHHRKDVFYYRKPVWARIQVMAMKDLLENRFTKVTPSLLSSTLQGKILGFSKIRFLPKEKGVRPIVNLGGPSSCIVRSSVQAEGLSFKQAFGKAGHSVEKTTPVGCTSAQKSSKHCPSKLRFFFKPVNSVLRDVHSCLKAELEGHAEDLGGSVFGYNDIYLRLVPFVMKLKSSQDGVPQLFFGVCDVAKAFDTIKQPKLCEIVDKFLQNEQYSVFRYVSVIPTTGMVRVCFKRACTASGEQHNFVDILTRRSPHAVYADEGISTKLSRVRTLAMLHDHVKKSMLQVGSTFYMRTVGIAQGSVLSSLFCSLFYGHLDKHYLLPSLQRFTEPRSTCNLQHHCRDCTTTRDSSTTQAPRNQGFSSKQGQEEFGSGVGENGHHSNWMEQNPIAGRDQVSGLVRDSIRFILLRLTDDSLFISTSKAQVSFFVEKMHNGFTEYGCHANKRKTATSFDMLLKGQVINENVYQTEDGARFMRWSGLLVNCHTLEIQADYSRYCGKDIRSTLTVVVEDNQGYNLSMKLCQFMRPKCHPLFYDLNINSPATVRLNAYQAFLLCAMKFHTYIRAMPRVGARNPNFLFKAICTSFRYMHRLIQQRMHGMMGDVSSVTPCFSFPINEMKWLGLLAFRKVLRRKQTSHKELILLLEAELSMKRYSEMASLLYLNSAVDDRRSSMFQSIKY